MLKLTVCIIDITELTEDTKCQLLLIQNQPAQPYLIDAVQYYYTVVEHLMVCQYSVELETANPIG